MRILIRTPFKLTPFLWIDHQLNAPADQHKVNRTDMLMMPTKTIDRKLIAKSKFLICLIESLAIYAICTHLNSYINWYIA